MGWFYKICMLVLRFLLISCVISGELFNNSRDGYCDIYKEFGRGFGI